MPITSEIAGGDRPDFTALRLDRTYLAEPLDEIIPD
jgi:hypothetical protein